MLLLTKLYFTICIFNVWKRNYKMEESDDDSNIVS